MLKKSFSKSLMLMILLISLLGLAACGKEPVKEDPTPTPSLGDVAVTEDPTPELPPETQPTPSGSNDSTGESVLAKVQGAADESGIYSMIITLSDQAADQGVIELVYYGPKGSATEHSIVNTFRIEYVKEEAGTYEIATFSNGVIDRNLHHKDKVKVDNTFGATVRAGRVVISYTPQGGETQEVYRADAEQFYAPTN